MKESLENKSFEELEKLKQQALVEGNRIDPYVEAQIRLLEKARIEFLKNAEMKGFQRYDFRVCQIEISQLTGIKQLAQSIGLPTDIYDENIKEIRIKVFGKENYRRFFEQEDKI